MAPVKDWNNAKKHEMRELAIPSRKVRRYLCCPASTCLEIRLLLDKKLLYKDSFIHAIEKDATQHNAIRANLNAWGLKSKYIIEGELTRIRLKGFVDKPFDGAWLDLCNPLTPDIMRWTSRELAAGVLAPGMEFSVTFWRDFRSWHTGHGLWGRKQSSGLRGFRHFRQWKVPGLARNLGTLPSIRSENRSDLVYRPVFGRDC